MSLIIFNLQCTITPTPAQEVMTPVVTGSNQSPVQSVDAITTENKPAEVTSRDRSSGD